MNWQSSIRQPIKQRCRPTLQVPVEERKRVSVDDVESPLRIAGSEIILGYLHAEDAWCERKGLGPH